MGRVTLDLNVALQFSKVPNNAQLEVLIGDAKAEGVPPLWTSMLIHNTSAGALMVAAQLPDGRRVKAATPIRPDATLWDALQHLDRETPGYIAHPEQ